jgi:type III pantothenate kinase
VSLLCLDCGNTRLKWGLRRDGAWSAQGALPLARLDEMVVDADRIVACNVAGERGRSGIEALANRLGVRLDWLRSSARCCGVGNGYEHPEQLGADRWAALIGARHLHGGACVVVGAGTATTVDVLAADGAFRGGLILPGLAMMREALVARTADLPSAMGVVSDLPGNTFDAIASGCMFATVGAIERMFAPLAHEPEAVCLLTGGAAPALAEHLRVPNRPIENLVLEGLARSAGA